MRQILLDANLLVLLVAGLTDPGLITKHRRTRTFSPEDFEMLKSILRTYGELLLTSHALSEASNLLGHTDQSTANRLRKALASLVKEATERHGAAKALVDNASFPKLGLTDVGILEAVREGPALLTTDFDLYQQAIREGSHATNFNHLRAI